MKGIVKYHNDLNRIELPHFNELEQNLLFSIFSKINFCDQHQHRDDNVFYFNLIELELFMKRSKLSDLELFKRVYGLFEKFFKADFRIIQKEKINENEIVTSEKRINLFSDIEIKWNENARSPKLYGLLIELNPKFSYILRALASHFTSFELVEFTDISGKYTKTLYRLLKQYRSTGLLKMRWDEFIKIMGIPGGKQIGEIERDILKPAIAELTRERTLFDQVRVPFENLTYEKIKDKSQRGRGGKIVAIVFNFKKQGDCIDVRTKDEKIEDLRVENSQLIQEKATVTIENNALKEKNEALKKVVGELQDQNFKMNFKEYTAMRVDNMDYGDTSEIIKVEKKKNVADLNSKTSYYIMATFKNLRTGVEWSFPFNNIDFFKNYLIKNSVLDETKMHNIAIADHRKININFR